MNTSETIPPLEKKLPWYSSKLFRGLAVFLAVILWFGLFAWWGVDWHHDGIMLAPVKQILEQKVLFRDVFCQYGPLAVWIQCIPASLFGAETLVIRLTTVLFYGFIALLGAKIWGRFLERPFLLVWYFCFFALCPFYLVTFHPWSSVYALFFMLLGVEFQLRFWEEGGTPWKKLFYSGCCAAAALLCRTPCGIVAFAGGMAVLLLYAGVEKTPGRFKGAACYGGGFGAVLALFGLYLAAAGAWSDFWQQCIVSTFNFAVTRGGDPLHLFVAQIFTSLDPWGADSWIFILFVLLTAGSFLLLCLKMCRSSRDEIRKKIPFLAVLMLTGASLHQYFPVPCVRHFWWAAIPAFGLYALTFQWIWRWQRFRKWRIALIVLLILPLVSPCCFRLVSAADNLKQLSEAVSSDLPGVRYSRIPRRDAAFLEKLYAAFQAQPSEIRERGVLNLTPDGLFSCLLPGPPKFYHPMFVNWYNTVYPDYFGVVDAFVDRYRPMILSTMFEKINGYEVIFSAYYQDKKFYFFAPCI